MIELVNGYVCHNCTDIYLAKRNVDPARPESDPLKPGAGAGKKTNPFEPSVKLTGLAAQALGDPSRVVSASAATKTTGARFDLSA